MCEIEMMMLMMIWKNKQIFIFLPRLNSTRTRSSEGEKSALIEASTNQFTHFFKEIRL